MYLLRSKHFLGGVMVCLLLVILHYTYVILTERGVTWPGKYNQGINGLVDLFSSTHQKNQPEDQNRFPITNQKEELGWRKPFHVANEDIHVPANVNVVDPQSIFTNKTADTGGVNSNCRKTRTNPAFLVCLYPRKQDIYISGQLMSLGVWEPHITKLYQTTLRRFPNATVIDAGANIGYYSLLAAAMGHPVIAVEPTEANMKKLAQGVQVNGFDDKVHVLYNALAENHRKVSMGVNINNQGSITLRENVGVNHTVQTIIMDDLLPFIHTQDVIIKMDVESHECQAMAASNKLFHNVSVQYMFIEWHGLYHSRMKAAAACPAAATLRMTDNFVRLGFLAHDAKSGRPLNPKNSPNWRRAGDVYWRHKDQPRLK